MLLRGTRREPSRAGMMARTDLPWIDTQCIDYAVDVGVGLGGPRGEGEAVGEALGGWKFPAVVEIGGSVEPGVVRPRLDVVVEEMGEKALGVGVENLAVEGHALAWE